MGKSGNPAKRAQQAAEPEPVEPPEPVEYDRAEAADDNGTEDFDAFWRAKNAKRRRFTNIRGQRVELPAELPLQFEMEAMRLKDSQDIEDIKRLVGILFGPDALQGWLDSGLGGEEFALLLAWAPQVIAGVDVTLAEVAEALEKAQAERNAADPR